RCQRRLPTAQPIRRAAAVNGAYQRPLPKRSAAERQRRLQTTQAIRSAAERTNGVAYFLKSRSKALRASFGVLGPGSIIGPAAGAGAAPSRATVTRGENRLHVLTTSLPTIRT